MNKLNERWSAGLTHLTSRHPLWVLAVALVITFFAMTLAGKLRVNLQMASMLPESSKSAQAYLRITADYPEFNTMVALEGPRDDIVAFASELGPIMEQMRHFQFVQWKAPTEFFFDHAMMIQEPDDLERMTRTFSNPGLIGSLGGFNDDYENEYTDDDGNMSRDEVSIAQSLLGTRRTLEVLYDNLSGNPDAAPISEAVDAMIVGEPWDLSLDRKLLVISAAPIYNFLDQDSIVAMSEDLEDVLVDLRGKYPTVEATQTGTAPIQREEVQAMSSNTMLMTLAALLLIYLLLAWNFRGAVMPLIALLPLIIGVVWTMGAIYLLFAELNLFTAMIMLMLIGLGVDFSIHLISRFYEERANGATLYHSTKMMLSGTGFSVMTGGLTTAAAFFVLIIGDTRGVREMGVSMAIGVILTLLTVFTMLPALLTLREKTARWFREKRGVKDAVVHSGAARKGLPLLGTISSAAYKRPLPALVLYAILLVLSVWAAMHNTFLWDFMEMEPKGLKSVQLLREFPDRFGVSSDGAWLMTHDIEESRALKEELRDLPAVGDVNSISDVITAPEWIEPNSVMITQYRQRMQRTPASPPTSDFDAVRLGEEVDRYWDNLDLMSNLAFQSGIDRVVKVIDGITGYDTETNSTDTTAILPRLSSLLADGVEPEVMARVATEWRSAMHTRLLQMANPEPVDLAMVPEIVRGAHLPKTGKLEYLLTITPREYLYNKEAYERFTSQVHTVNPSITSSTQMAVEVMIGTVVDASDSAIVAIILIIILLVVHFRSPVGLLAVIPLLGGTVFMLGTMFLLGMKYNYMNFIAMPIILGIGVDDGVHALHRWREEGGTGEERVRNSFKFVGRAILLTTLTTMIGFGSLAFYEMRAISSFGLLLFIGVGYCFLTTLTLLPAAMRFIKTKKKLPNTAPADGATA